mgnify:CR=1 FL=1
MFQNAIIANYLPSRVGFRTSPLIGYNIVTSANQVSNSGLYVNDISPVISIKNLKDCQEDPNVTDANFNTILTNIKNSACNELLQRVFAQSSDFLERVVLFPHEQSYKNIEAKGTKFVGYKFRLNQWHKAVTHKVNSIILSMDTDQQLNVYMFSSTSPANPINTEICTIVGGRDNIITPDDWVMSANSLMNKGGDYYIGYFETQLTGNAYLRDWESAPVMIQPNLLFTELVNYTIVGNGIDISTYNANAYSKGLNLDISTYIDFTDEVVNNLQLFDRAYQLQVAIKCIEIIMLSPRSNITERLMKELKQISALELYGNKELNAPGLYTKLENEINVLKRSLLTESLITIETLS